MYYFKKSFFWFSFLFWCVDIYIYFFANFHFKQSPRKGNNNGENITCLAEAHSNLAGIRVTK